MAKPVRISSDSTVDLSPELIERFRLHISPLLVTLGEDTFQDGVDIGLNDVFRYAKESGKLAKTACQSTAYCSDMFADLTADGSAVIHFTISGTMSSSYNFARIAAEDFEDVYVVDTQNLSTGSGLLVLKAAQMAADGVEAKEIYDTVCALRDKVDASFVLDTLEYLHKGGRCSTIAMLGANVLKLKPAIQVTNGTMDVGKKYRGKISAVYREYIADQLHDPDDIDLERAFVTTTCTDDGVAVELAEYVRSLVPFREILITKAGCTIASHCGPECMGVLFIRKSAKQ